MLRAQRQTALQTLLSCHPDNLLAASFSTFITPPLSPSSLLQHFRFSTSPSSTSRLCSPRSSSASPELVVCPSNSYLAPRASERREVQSHLISAPRWSSLLYKPPTSSYSSSPYLVAWLNHLPTATPGTFIAAAPSARLRTSPSTPRTLLTFFKPAQHHPRCASQYPTHSQDGHNCRRRTRRRTEATPPSTSTDVFLELSNQRSLKQQCFIIVSCHANKQ